MQVEQGGEREQIEQGKKELDLGLCGGTDGLGGNPLLEPSERFQTQSLGAFTFHLK